MINKTYVNFNSDIDYKILSETQILNILNKCCNSLEESIKTFHFNKNLPEYNNIFITNLKNDIAYIFDGIKFSAVSKNEAIDDLISTHMNEIEASAEEYKGKINILRHKNLIKFINQINDDNNKFFNEKLKKTYPNFKIFKGNLIKKLIYNYSDTKLLEKLKTFNLQNKIINT